MQESIDSKLTRIETKLIRGFEELGADTSFDHNWLSVAGSTIYVNTLGRSLTVLIATAKKQGAKLGEQKYDVMYRDKIVAVI